MRIKSVKLQNFGRFQSFETKIDPGLVGVLGSNGSGKSTIVNAIYAAITGDFSRSGGDKGSCVCDMARPGETSSVEVRFVHHDAEFCVTRTLAPRTAAKLSVNGEISAIGAGDVDAALAARLQVSPTLLGDYLFVAQEQLSAFLRATPMQRAEVYAQLCGTGRAEQICAAITKFKADTPTLSAVREDRTDMFRRELSDAETRLAVAEARRESFLAERLSPELVASYEKVKSDYESAEATQAARLRLEASIARREQAVEHAACELANSKAALTELRRGHQTYADNIEAARAKREEFARAERAAAAQSGVRASLAACQRELAALVEVPAPQGDVDEMRRREAELRVALEHDTKMLYTFDRGGVVECPTCGTPTESLSEHLAEARKRAPETQRRVDALRADIAQHARATTARAAYERKRADLDSRRATYEGQLTDAPVTPPSAADKKTLDDFIAAHDAQVRRIQELALEVKSDEKQLRAAETELKTTRAELQGLATVTIVPRETYDHAKEELVVNARRVAEIVALDAQIRLLQSNVKVAQGRLDEERAACEQQAKYLKFRDLLDVVRNEVFHPKALPAMIAEANLRGLVGYMNTVLASFGSPFTVVTAENLVFQVQFPGEPVRPVYKLSGGQKIVFAIIFRMAVLAQCSADVGLLILDEPTAYLDAANVAYLSEILNTVKAAKRQVIIVTHEADLLPVFDQVISL